MFVPKAKADYTNNLSDLAVRVIKVHHVGKDYVKFVGELYNKNNGIIYERKNYKLPLKRIQDWKLLKKT